MEICCRSTFTLTIHSITMPGSGSPPPQRRKLASGGKKSGLLQRAKSGALSLTKKMLAPCLENLSLQTFRGHAFFASNSLQSSPADAERCSPESHRAFSGSWGLAGAIIRSPPRSTHPRRGPISSLDPIKRVVRPPPRLRVPPMVNTLRTPTLGYSRRFFACS